MPEVSVHVLVEEIEMLEVLSYMVLIVAAVVCSICWMKYYIARRSCIKFKQERTSSHDSASPSTPNHEVLDTDDSNVDARTHESSDVKEFVKSSSHDYEVFLSFRGPDTRLGITDFLYTSLVEAGIRTYRDDEELRVGEEIGPELLQAIKQSKIAIPIFSKGYASSKWCLMELVQMVECKNEIGQKIIPIFYNIEPAAVRHQTGDYRKAFDMHAQKKRSDDRTIEKWKVALKQVGALKGWDLASMPNRREGELAKEVTRSVLIELKKTYLEVSDCLVEVDSKIEEIMRLIGMHYDETKIIGIHGMGGIGKTTIAKTIYNRLSRHFQNCCFLANIREASDQKGIECLQNQLISDILKTKLLDINNVDEGINMIKARLSSKKVLLLLDDVDKKIQLNSLMGNRNWYGKGSKVIITTRNKEILNVPEVDWSYELMSMDFDHSLRLFSRHAFRRDHPLEEYYALSRKAVEISGGLPLALEVMGSFLSGKHKKFWDNTLKKLEKVPHEDIRKKLMISIETLDNQQKNIFLDISCLFIGFDKGIVNYMWDSCDFFPEEAIEVLLQRSLIKIRDDNRLWMHDQLRDLGRDIVRQQSNGKLEEQSRVWDHGQALDVRTRIKGKKNIEAICLEFDHRSQYSFTNKEFASLPNLRFLQVDSLHSYETIQPVLAQLGLLRYNWHSNVVPTKIFSKKPLTLSKLRWLSWHNFPQGFKVPCFSLTELVILDLSKSKITENWDGWNHIKMAKNLKVLNLTRCERVKRTPIFSSHMKLEQLILEGCCRLAQIDKSIGQLTHLVLLNINYCKKLRKLPNELGKLETLMRLSLVGTRFIQLPNSIGQLVSLVELDLAYSSIIELPHTMGKMKNLKVLRLRHCSLKTLPGSIGMLEKLEEIDCEYCPDLQGEIPSDIAKLPLLRILKLTYAQIELIPKLPESLNSLWLETSSMMTLEDCSNQSNLKDLKLYLDPKDPIELLEHSCLWWIGTSCKLESLEFGCGYCTTISVDIIRLSQLKKLVLCCLNLRCLPQLPSSLLYLCLEGCGELSTSIDVSNLVALEELEVSCCMNIKEIQGLECLENLRRMSLGRALGLKQLLDLTNLKQLGGLTLVNCPNVIELKGLPPSLSYLCVNYCGDLFTSTDLSNSVAIEELEVINPMKIKEIKGLEFLENLRRLIIEKATSLKTLPDLTNFKQLRILKLYDCPNMTELRGTSESLEIIDLHYCPYLEKLPRPSSFKKLECLIMYGCKRLDDYLESSDDWGNWKKRDGAWVQVNSTGEDERVAVLEHSRCLCNPLSC